jgi:hypothetical protein
MSTNIARGNINGLGVVTLALTPVSVAAATTAEQLFTVPGVRLATDIGVVAQKFAAQAGLDVGSVRVSADNQVGITFVNATAAPIVPTAAELYKIVLIRTEAVLGSFQI